MKTITIPQPQATLIAVGALEFDVRSWAPNELGPILIHARKARDDEKLRLCYEEPFRTFLREAGYTYINELPFGAIVAAARIKCVRWSDTVRLLLPDDSPEKHFSDFRDGLRVWQYWRVRRFKTPVPAVGDRYVWDWPCPKHFRPELIDVPPVPARDTVVTLPPFEPPAAELKSGRVAELRGDEQRALFDE
jgi:hypothetical protein